MIYVQVKGLLAALSTLFYSYCVFPSYKYWKLSRFILTDGSFFTLLSTKAILALVTVSLLLWEAPKANLCLGEEDNKELSL